MNKRKTESLENCCHYCGDWFQCRDHFIPISYLRLKRDYRKNETVKCCNSCNLILSDNIFSSMEERSRYILQTIYIKYKKLLKLPVWESEDIEKLDYSLKTRVTSHQFAKQNIESRVSNLILTSSGLNPIPLNYTYDPFVLERIFNKY